MARKDDVFMSFIKHELISEKYNLIEEDIPNNLTIRLVPTPCKNRVISELVVTCRRMRLATILS